MNNFIIKLGYQGSKVVLYITMIISVSLGSFTTFGQISFMGASQFRTHG